MFGTVCCLHAVNRLSSKSKKLQAKTLMEFLIFCCLIKLSGIKVLHVLVDPKLTQLRR